MDELRAVFVETGESDFQDSCPAVEILGEATPIRVEAVEIATIVAAFELTLGVSCEREDLGIGLG